MNNKLRTALIVMISLVWSVNFTAPLYLKGFKPPAEINLAFMGVVGLLSAGYKSENKEPKQYEPVPNPVPEPEPPPPPPPKPPARKTAAKKVTKAPAKKRPAKKPAKKVAKKQQPRKRGSR